MKLNYFFFDKVHSFIINKSRRKSNKILKQNKNIEYNNLSKNNSTSNNTPKKPKGLENFSLNCYMNSLCQCLYNITELRTELLNPNEFDPKKKPVTNALSQIFNG